MRAWRTKTTHDAIFYPYASYSWHMSSPIESRRRQAPRRTAARDARKAVRPDVRRILDAFRLEDVGSHLLRRAHFLAEELFAREFAAEGITPRQKAALVIVYQQPGLNQNSLADRLHMDRNTVAEMVRRLVTAGLLERVGAADDQRAYELFLTSAGADLLNRVMPRDAAVEMSLLERLPAEYRPLFLKCLHLLSDPPPAGTAPPAAESAILGAPRSAKPD